MKTSKELFMEVREAAMIADNFKLDQLIQKIKDDKLNSYYNDCAPDTGGYKDIQRQPEDEESSKQRG